MKVILEFLKTTLVGGLLVVLPLLLFYLLFSELLDLIIALATPIAGLFPAGTFERFRSHDLLAWLLILLSSFLCGLAVRLHWLTSLGRWLESHTLAMLPIYRAIKQLARGLIGVSSGEAFRGGLLRSGDGIEEMVYIIEELGDGRTVVLLPFAPASFTGTVKIVPTAMVTPLAVSAGEVSRVIAHWGVGTAEVLAVTSQKSPESI
jgi:uncharacterized membrane protein